ncbi:MAG: hypothetical protein GYA41_10065 [Bacteroidales bacterium]|nr:hypothetical protein [Bacteroidales bacterium]
MKQLYSLHKISVSLLLFFLFLKSSGIDGYRYVAGAPESGMAGSCVMKPDFWSSFYNQASLPFIRTRTFGINYDNRFCLKELGTGTAGLIFPSGRATLGVVCSHFGYKDFRRQSAAIACGLKLSGKTSAGIQIDYFRESFPGTENKTNSVTFEGGLLFDVTENIRLGMHVFNPVPNSLRKNSLHSGLSAGAGIQLNKLFFASAEVGMVTGEKIVIMTGIEYSAAENIRIRGGFRSENNSFSFGFGYEYRHVRLDLGFASHDRLGITSSASMILQFKN